VSAPPQAVAALAWAIVGPPFVVFAATRVRRGRTSLHAGLMIAAVVIELAVFTAFMFLMPPGARRPALAALPFFKIHLTFAVAAFAGMAWQLGSRAVAPLRPYHRRSGPYVALVWCLALLTGIYNYVFIYVMHTS
jgi:uncharacterized membrane protein YozB (DUF420 family)